MHRRFGALLAVIGLSSSTACETSTKHDDFDPTGIFEGAVTVVGQSGGVDVVLSDVETITLADDAMVLGNGCSLKILDSSEVGVEDTGDDGDDDSASTVRELAKVQTPLAGQSCTITTADGGRSVTFETTNGLIQAWRANDDVTLQITLSGTTPASGNVTYTFTGYR